MNCKNCKTQLSLYNIDRNVWLGKTEEFIFICPKCNVESKFITYIFKGVHLSLSCLEMLVVDSDNQEKQLNYMPKEKRNMILEHLTSCPYCSNKLEEIRLLKISNELCFNREVFDFFMSQASNISILLKDDEVKTNDIGIKSFKFNNNEFFLSKKHLFYDLKKENEHFLCYTLERNNCSIGMASFLKKGNQINLDKIWIKSELRLLKEKILLRNISTGEMSALINLVRKT